MKPLYQQACEACQASFPHFSEAQLNSLMQEIPTWELIVVSDIMKLSREFCFSNYQQAVDFTNKVASLAEEHNHHPAILTEWGKTTVTWWTHTINGLHKNDFILAAKTDRL